MFARRFLVVLPLVTGCGSGGDAGGDDGDAGDAGTDTSATTTGGDSGDTGSIDPCEGVDCDGHGQCVELEGGGAMCDCEEGYLADGLSCNACMLVSDPFDIDVPGVIIDGTTTFGGAAAPDPVSGGYGRLTLVDPVNGDTVFLTETGPSGFETAIVPGIYDLRYAVQNNGNNVPNNTFALILGGVPLLESQTLDIDIPGVIIEGQTTFGGETAFEPGAGGYGRITFVNAASGDIVAAGDTSPDGYAVAIVPGVYDVHYSVQDASNNVPRNSNARILSGVDLTESQMLDIDVPGVVISGATTFGGVEAFEPGAGGYGTLTLVNPVTADVVPLTDTNPNGYSTAIVPGVYDLHYSVQNAGNNVPVNANARIMTGVDLTSSQTMDIDIPGVLITGMTTFGGEQAPAPGGGGYAQLTLVSADGVDRATLAETSPAPYTTAIIPGTYDLRYTVVNTGNNVPRNTNARLATGLDLSESQTLDVDVPGVIVDGTTTFGGQPAPAPGSGGYGVLELVGDDGLDRAALGDTNPAGFSAAVIPGTYDLRYRVQDTANNVPVNTDGLVQSDLDLNSSTTLPIDIPGRILAGATTFGGTAAPDPGAGGFGVLRLVNPASADTAALTDTNPNGYSTAVMPGVYNLVYSAQDTSNNVPGNTAAVLACVQVP